MTNEKMIEEVGKCKKRFSPELIESLVKFYDEFDPYGVLDFYGDISVKSHREKMKTDIRYLLKNDPNQVISDIKYDMEEANRET